MVKRDFALERGDQSFALVDVDENPGTGLLGTYAEQSF